MSNLLRDPAPRSISLLAAGVRNVAHVFGPANAAGSITFAANLAADDTVTINGVVFTAVAADAAGAEFNIGASLSLSLDALVTVLNASTDDAVKVATYAKSGTTILSVVHDTAGEAGDAFTLAASVGVVSGATLEGGAETDFLDTKENSVFSIKTAPGAARNLALARGIEDGQEIVIYLDTKGAGANAVVGGVFAGGTTLTFDTAGELAKLIWINEKWVPIVNTATLA